MCAYEIGRMSMHFFILPLSNIDFQVIHPQRHFYVVKKIKLLSMRI